MTESFIEIQEKQGIGKDDQKITPKVRQTVSLEIGGGDSRIGNCLCPMVSVQWFQQRPNPIAPAPP
jgi:hypothetical protein